MSIDFEIEPDCIIKEYSKVEAKEIIEKWMNIYCKNKQGYNTKAFKWHIFSGGGYPSSEKDEAFTDYASHVAPDFLIMENDKDSVVLASSKPSHCSLVDYYVFPQNMAWTMAFTHEQGWLGPYFAKHPNYKSLNKVNIDRIKKLEQIDIAKQKGWL